MNNHKYAIWKSAMNAGAIVGGGLIAFSLLLTVLNLSTSQVAGFLVFAALVAGIFFTGKYYRDKQLGGYISYEKALGYGVLVCLFTSIIMAFFTYLQLKFIEPGLIDTQIQLMEENMLQKGMNEQQVEMTISLSRKFMQPEIAPFMVVLSYVFYGAIFSLVTSIFLKRKANPFESAMQEVDEMPENKSEQNNS